MATKRGVAVRILGHEYRIRSDSDEAAVQRVAAYVDETMAKIRERTRTVDSLDLAILAALNLANDLLATRGGGGSRAAEAGARDAASGADWLDPDRVRALIEIAESAAAVGPR